MAWIIGATVFGSFGKALLRHEFSAETLHSPFVRIHEVVFFGWIALFVVQTILITAARPDVHRRMGLVGAVLAGSMVVLASVSTIRAFATGQQRLFFADPHLEIIVFVALAMLGYRYRRQSEAHKRLMLLATIALLGAATAHTPFIGHLHRYAYLVVQDLFIVAGVAYDIIARGRVHPAYVWGGALICSSQLVITNSLVM
jgi:FtsH-binding integral membrane protein